MKFPGLILILPVLLLAAPGADLFAEGTQFQIRRILEEKETVSGSPEVFPYRRGPVSAEVTVTPEAVLTASDVDYATVRVKPEIWNQLPPESWKEAADGFRELLYMEDPKQALPADPRLEFVLTAPGKEKLEEFTRRHIRSGAAVIGHSQVLSRAVILAPVTDGKVKLFHVEKTLNGLVKFVNDMGVRLLVKPAPAETPKA